MEYEESQWEPGRWKELQKVPGNQATVELVLHGHLNYQFRVYAVNAVGPGPPSEPTERYKTPPAGETRSLKSTCSAVVISLSWKFAVILWNRV